MNVFANASKYSLINFNSLAIKQCVLTAHCRAASLYAANALGVDKYVNTRDKVAAQMHGLTDKFRSKMQNFVGEDSKNMIFTEDLKSMVHITDVNDIELLCHMVLKFNKQNKDLRFGSFIFGPVVMRLFHHLDKPEEALKIFEHPETDGFFDQQMSYHILMDLLYKHEMYNDVLKVFEYAVSKQAHMTKYPKHLVVLAVATCYKQNTPQSFEYAKKLWANLSEIGHIPMRRAVTFFSALALNQGAPHISIEVLSSLRNQTYVTLRSLKIAALAELNRADDALPVLRSVLDFDTGENVKNTFTIDSIERLKLSVEKSNNADIKREFKQTLKGLEDRQLIDNKSLDDLLCMEIQQTIQTQSQDSRLHSSFQNTQSFNRRPYARQGLSDNTY